MLRFVFFQEPGDHAGAVAQGKGPGQGTGQNDPGEGHGGGGSPGADAPACQFSYTTEDRMGTVSHALQGVAHDHETAVEAEQSADEPQVPDGQNGSFTGLGAHDQLCEGTLAKENSHPGEDTVGKLNGQTGKNTLLDPVIPVCTGILTGEGGNAAAYGFHRQGEHHPDLFAGDLSGDDSGAKGIDSALHNDITHGRNGIFKAHGQTHGAKPSGVAAGEGFQSGGCFQQVRPEYDPA